MIKAIIASLILITSTGLQAALPEQACKQCHEKAYQAWQGSHHALAMQEATEKSVLGDFDDALFNYAGITSRFYQNGKQFMVRTDNEKGQLQDFEIAYTFGVFPLQQYMVEFPDGRIQVLDIAWDSRSKPQGGQRWYHLHPGEAITAGDALHWTGPNMNWNFMCADCHSSNVKKNYDPVTKRYDTDFSHINVSCSACHGDASEHLKWTQDKKRGDNGFAFKLMPSRFDYATRKGDLEHRELAVCARCHSRRAQLNDHFVPGEAFHDHYQNVTLEERLYFSDGQIKDEVFVYNSFLQSKMYQSGVACNDCHSPHSLQLKAPGDQVCAQCHQPTTYQTALHHRHQDDSAGASCVACHMPSRVYMGVDERNDHSFRIPRPDRSLDSDLPNACNQCHTGKNAQWATAAITRWYPTTPIGKPHFADVLLSLQTNSRGAYQALHALFKSPAPEIAQATAAGYLGRYPSQQSFTATLQLLGHENPDIRLNALRSLEGFPLRYRAKQTFDMLGDKTKGLRIEAARQLSGIPQGNLAPALRTQLTHAIDEYQRTLLFNADRAESQNGLAALYGNLGQLDQAKAAYIEALRLNPSYMPTYINFANYYQRLNDEASAHSIIQQGLARAPENAALHHVLGLWHVRQKQKDPAQAALGKAAELEPDNARYQYIYAVAVAETRPERSVEILEASLKRNSGDVDTINALINYLEILSDPEKQAYYQEYFRSLYQP